MSRTWIRMYTDLPYSAKIQRLPDHLFRFLMNCWCLTGASKDECLPEVSDVAFKLHIDPDICGAYVDHLLKQNLLTRKQGSGKIVPKNWDTRQFLSDSAKDRTRKYRERLKKPEVKRHSDVTVTAPETDSDTDTDSDTEQKQKEPVAMTPEMDEQFIEYRRLFRIVGNPIDEEFAQGSFCWLRWRQQDFTQRQALVESLRVREAAGVRVLHTPESYITKLEYKRPVMLPRSSPAKRDIVAEMIAEEAAKNG